MVELRAGTSPVGRQLPGVGVRPFGDGDELVVLDLHGRVLHVPAHLSALLGRPARDVLGRRLEELVAPVDRAAVAGWWSSLTGAGEDQGAADSAAFVPCRLLAAGGPAATVLVGMAMRRDGEVVGVEVAVRRQSGGADMGEGVARANEQLLRFAHDTAHDLRTPLAAVSGFAELLARVAGPRLELKEQEALTRLLQNVYEMDGIIEGSLRSLVAGVETEPTEVDLDEVLAEVRQALRVPDDAHVHVGRLGTTWGQAVPLTQLFEQLLANAVAYRSPERPLRILVSARTEGDERIFTVRDNGTGIAEADRESVFDRFVRATERGRGAGLGLPLCRQIVERHGGRIWIDGSEGCGTSVSFSLPASGP